jgi:molybdate-binding protein/DNA-binding transcriptional regulator YhcF (GntR family)
MDVFLDKTSGVPLYQQVVERVKRLVALGDVTPGMRLPTVREAASSLNINPGTVLRAYHELEREGIIVSRPGRGTEVTADSQDPNIIASRVRRLNGLLSESILSALGLGYSPAEIETSFMIQLALWREGQKSEPRETAAGHVDLRIVASDDIALDLLVARFKALKPDITVQLDFTGSLGGLIALQQGKADLAGIHLLDVESGEYNYPYIKRLLPGVKVSVISLAYRAQGLIVASGNPKKIKGLEDLRRPDVVMINRQSGSGTRVLLDLKLLELGIRPEEIRGYNNETKTHFEVANAVASGKADVGLGIAIAAKGFGLDFVPLFRERYDLVVPVDKLEKNEVNSLFEIVRSEEFRKTVAELDGYDSSETGSVHLLGGKEAEDALAR